jgi:hypothetical protein
MRSIPIFGLHLGRRVPTSLLCVAFALCGVASGRSQEKLPNPIDQAPVKLQKLSNFVDQHLKKVQSFNQSVSKKSDIGATGGLAGLRKFGSTQLLENMIRLEGLESAGRPRQFDFMRDHQQELQTFAASVRQISKDISGLSPLDATKRLDAVIVPGDLQLVLQLGSDGSTLPAPPHLQRPSVLGPMTLTPFVVGPGIAATVDYPAVAEIAYAWPGHGSSALCTGTLISANAVLTAAHCFCEFAQVRTAAACSLATYLRGLESVRPTDQRFISVFFHDRGAVPVKEIIISPNYNFPKADLAIVRLDQDIQDIMPAPLNVGKSLKPGEFATIVGFGAHNPLKADGTPMPGPPVRASEGLKLWATIKTAPCKGAQFGESVCWTYQQRIADQLLGSTCHGDSGGPTFATIDGVVKLVGVTSGGPDDCSAGADQSFDVDVQKHAPWITSVAGDNVNPAFAANPGAFIANPSNRAYGAPYHLFINRPDQSTGQFFVPASMAALKVSVNTTPTFSTLSLEVTAPDGGQPACTASGNDAFASCEIATPKSGNWSVRVQGSSPQESQVVATVRR